MKKIITLIKRKEAHKLAVSAFIFCAGYITLYELVFTIWATNSFAFYKLGVLLSRICYSISAAAVFYLITQYLPVYLPKQKRKIKILYGVFLKTKVIETRVENLKFELGIHGNDFYNKEFNEKIEAINSDEPVDQFENWHLYLHHFKTAMIDIIRSMTIYNDFLSLEFIEELTFIEYQLLSLYAFEGRKTLQPSSLSYAMIQLQEILVHNRHLQELKATEFAKYKKIFQTEGDEYRMKYYSSISENGERQNA